MTIELYHFLYLDSYLHIQSENLLNSNLNLESSLGNTKKF